MAKKYKSKKAATKAAKKAVTVYKSDKVGERKPVALSDTTVLARWTCKLKHIDHFDFDWEYRTAAGTWVQGDGGVTSVPASSTADDYYQTTFTAPSDESVSMVRYQTRAVAKKHNVTKSYTVKDKKTKKTVTKKVTVNEPYWTAQWSGWKDMVAPAAAAATAERVREPDAPGAPSAELNADGSVTVTWTAVASPATHVAVCRVEDGKWDVSQRVEVAPMLGRAATLFTDYSASSGHVYRYFLIAYNGNGGGWSDPGGHSSEVTMQPQAPAELSARALSPTSAKLEWRDGGYSGDGYVVEYSTNASAWDDNAQGDIQSATVSGTPTEGGYAYTVTGLATGATWYFRVLRTAGSLRSPRSDMVSSVLGTVPAAPSPVYTLGSYYRGETVTLQWTHNCEDGSEQGRRRVLVEAKAPGSGTFAAAVDDTAATADGSYELDTSGFADGTELRWKVQTQGILRGEDAWSPWSEQLSFRVWAKPELTVSLTHDGVPVGTGAPLPALPLTVTLRTGAASTGQSALEWAWSIVADEGYPYVDDDGENDYIAPGTEVASGYIDWNDADFDAGEQRITVSAGDAAFVTGQTYTVRATAAMDSGLRTDEASAQFATGWDDSLPTPTMTISPTEDYSAHIYPACYDADDETGEAAGLTDGVTLSVYRINADRTLVRLASGLPNTGSAVVVDPHPNFGTCWYRVCANNTATDVTTVFDECELFPFDFMLIQWDERVLQTTEEQAENMLSYQSVELPYNLQVDESFAPDVVFREYAGREHPVPLWGTQKGQSASVTLNVPLDETVDIDALRRLFDWPGSSYVRLPTGAGYRAVVTPGNISQGTGSALASVSLSVTRVEGDEEAVSA